MKKIYFFSGIFLFALLPGAFSQLAFTNANARLNNTGHSGCSVTITDWNFDGMDDIVRLDDGQNVYVEVQRTNNTYETRYLGTFGGGSGWAWAMCVADVDHNGYKDIIAGGYSGADIMMVDNTGTTGNVTSIGGSFFLQNLTFGDFNNDGWIDIFCCDDNDAAHVFVNDGTGNLNPSTIIPTAVNPGVFINGDPADSGNYGSVWTDFDDDGDLDLYVIHCRQGVGSSSDPRRINRLFVNDGSNNYTEMGATYGLDMGWQSWTASFGDIDNDGDLDVMVTNHDVPSQILQNDGTGHYTDITLSTGFDISDITPIESVMEDFDNDGFIDILAAGSDSRYYKNNGNGTFTLVTGLFDNNNLESFSIGDVNHDGFTDLYASYADIYTTPTSVDDVIWMNTGNTNHFFTLDLRGEMSNHNAIGARAKIYGAWGVQIREVRSGESYGTVNSSMLHFGLGQATGIDSVVISWPAGSVQTIISPAIDQFLTVKEGDCISPEAIITSTGGFILCTGQSLTLDAPAGFDYLWSDGSTLQSLLVSAPGEYNVQLSVTGNNCTAISKTCNILLNPDQTPVIIAAGPTEFCGGNSVQLNATPGMSSYLWSNGDTSQDIIVSQSGTYILTVQGACQQWTSAPVGVTVHIAVPPVSNDVTITGPASATLNATGNNISWYDLPSAGTLLGTGNSYMTPVLTDTTVYYVESADSYGGGIFPTGKPSHTGTSLYSGSASTNATTSFNVYETCTLKTVKVYTDLPGYRLLELRDNAGWLLNTAYVNIVPDSQVIMLDWELLPGTDYTIGTNEDTNLVIPGWANNGPRLQRNSTDVTYPYTLGGVLDITGSSQGGSLYYYFYDWQVEKLTTWCPSNRVAVTVNVNTPVGIIETANNKIRIYPNPASEIIMVENLQQTGSEIRIFDGMARLVLHQHLAADNGVIDVTRLDKGIYSLKIDSAEKSGVYKLVIQ